MNKMNQADFVERERHLGEAAKIVPGETLPPVTQESEEMPVGLPVIPLSEEQRRILEQPVDPRVERILSKIGGERNEMAGVVPSLRICSAER